MQNLKLNKQWRFNYQAIFDSEDQSWNFFINNYAVYSVLLWNISYMREAMAFQRAGYMQVFLENRLKDRIWCNARHQGPTQRNKNLDHSSQMHNEFKAQALQQGYSNGGLQRLREWTVARPKKCHVFQIITNEFHTMHWKIFISAKCYAKYSF